MKLVQDMTTLQENQIKEKILEENRRVHALENRLYLARHPEQTNFHQTALLNQTIDSVAGLISGTDGRVLELGCGTGYLYLNLLQRGFHMTGVDLSREMIESLRERVPEDARARSRLVVADIDEFADNDSARYDAVVMSALLHHLYDYESVVRIWASRLRPGGVFLVFFEPLKQKIDSPIRFGLHRLLSRFDELLYRVDMNWKNIPLLEEEYHWSDYQRQFGGIDPDRIGKILQSSGMEVLEVRKYCARRFGLNAFLATRLLNTSNTFNILARKFR